MSTNVICDIDPSNPHVLVRLISSLPRPQRDASLALRVFHCVANTDSRHDRGENDMHKPALRARTYGLHEPGVCRRNYGVDISHWHTRRLPQTDIIGYARPRQTTVYPGYSILSWLSSGGKAPTNTAKHLRLCLTGQYSSSTAQPNRNGTNISGCWRFVRIIYSGGS